MEGRFVIAGDIGGTNIRVALADSNCRLLARYSEPTRAAEGPEQGIRRLKDMIRQSITEVPASEIRGIAVATAGPLDPQAGVILTPPSLPTWHRVDIKSPLETEFGLPVWVESDADMAAIGEQRLGAGRGYHHLIYITVSTGIGGGVIIDDKLLRGSRISAAEIGHIVVDPRGPRCNCGGTGHVEALASGTAIARMACERIEQGESSQLLALAEGDLSRISAALVAQAARSGDLLASDVMCRAGSYLGIAIVSLVHIFDPQIVIIGGGVSNGFDLLIDPINKEIAERGMPDYRNNIQIVRSSLGDDSGILGAVAFALDNVDADI